MHENGALQEFCRIESFSQPAEFRRLRNFLHAATIHPTLLTSWAFYFLTHFVPLLAFFLICHHCNSICFWFFGILYDGLAIKAPKPSTVKKSLSLKKFLFGRKLSTLPPLFLLLHFLSFSFIFSAAKHPLRMTTQGMVG